MSTAAPPPEIRADATESVLDPRPAPSRLDADSAGMAMTRAEYEAVDEWDRAYRFEWLDGRIVVSPAPNWRERDTGDFLAWLLRNYRRTAAGKAADVRTLPEHDIRTSRGVRRADRAIWCGLGRKPKVGVDVPTIAVEVVSKEKRDRHRDFVEKRREYLEAGVKEYWIVDPTRRTLTVCVTAEGDGGRRTLRESEVYRTDLMPGLSLAVAELFAAGDEFED